MVRHKKNHGLRLRSLFLWHRYLGLAAAAFVAALAISGLLINYSDDLQLSKRYIQTGWLLNWYGITQPVLSGAYPAGTRWVTQIGDRIYFDDHEINNSTVPLHGALRLANKIVIAAGEQLLLLTPQGDVIDRLGGAEGVPTGALAIGVAGDKIVLRTPHGAFQADDQFLRWRPSDIHGIRWAETMPIPDALRNDLLKRYRGAGISWERLLLDLHSGRLFGKGGVAIMNISAFLMLLLAISGIWHFFQRKRR